MANVWMDRFPRTTSKFLDEMDAILGLKLSGIIQNGPNSTLNQTQNAQPAVMAVSVLILRILEIEFGFNIESRVDFTLGHSLGEFTALIASGHLAFPDALRLVRRRAEVMAQCTQQMMEKSGDNYGMIALICEAGHLEGLLATIHQFLDHESSRSDYSGHHQPCPQVVVANINSPSQIVLSGSIKEIKALLVQIRQFGGHDPRAVRLKSDSPFHNPAMLPAALDMKHVMNEVGITFPGKIPCISNVSALPFHSKNDLKNLLSRQCTDTVKWWDSIRYLHQTQGIRRWIGIGPGKVGRNLVGKEVGRVNTKGGGVWAVSHPKEMEETLLALDQTEFEVQYR